MSRRGVLDLCIHVRSASTVSAKLVQIASSLCVRHAETLSELRLRPNASGMLMSATAPLRATAHLHWRRASQKETRNDPPRP